MGNVIIRLGVIGALIPVTTFAQTYISGDITEDQIWNVAESPYYIVGDTFIKNGAQVTIWGRTEIIFPEDESVHLYVGCFGEQGCIVTLGNPADRIIFTDSNYTPGSGGKIVFLSNTGVSSRFEYCDFINIQSIDTNGWDSFKNCYFYCDNNTDRTYFLRVFTLEDYTPGTTYLLDNCSFNNHPISGLVLGYPGDPLPTITIDGTTFSDCATGIETHSSETPIPNPILVESCTFTGCGIEPSSGLGSAIVFDGPGGYPAPEFNVMRILNSVFIDNERCVEVDVPSEFIVSGTLFQENVLCLDIKEAGIYEVKNICDFDNNDSAIILDKGFLKVRDSFIVNSYQGNYQAITLNCAHNGADFGTWDFEWGNNIISGNEPWDMVSPGQIYNPGIIPAIGNTWDHELPAEIELYDIYDANDNPSFYLDVRVWPSDEDIFQKETLASGFGSIPPRDLLRTSTATMESPPGGCRTRVTENASSSTFQNRGFSKAYSDYINKVRANRIRNVLKLKNKIADWRRVLNLSDSKREYSIRTTLIEESIEVDNRTNINETSLGSIKAMFK
jgi:hypothetical protein